MGRSTATGCSPTALMPETSSAARIRSTAVERTWPASSDGTRSGCAACAQAARPAAASASRPASARPDRVVVGGGQLPDRVPELGGRRRSSPAGTSSPVRSDAQRVAGEHARVAGPRRRSARASARSGRAPACSRGAAARASRPRGWRPARRAPRRRARRSARAWASADCATPAIALGEPGGDALDRVAERREHGLAATAGGERRIEREEQRADGERGAAADHRLEDAVERRRSPRPRRDRA